MKAILKLLAIGTALAGAVCLVVVFWDKIMDAVDNVMDKIEERKSGCCCDGDLEDFADCDL